MKGLVTALIVALIALGAWFLMARTQTNRELTDVRTELDTRTSELEQARAEVGKVRKTMQENLDTLQTELSTLRTEKQTFEEKLLAFSGEMADVQGELQQATQLRKASEEKTLELEASLEGVRGELELATKEKLQLAKEYEGLRVTHEQTLNQFAEVRRDYVVVTKENEELEAKLNDLDALKTQIRAVKVDLRNQRIEEWKRSDRIAGDTGNRGFIMKNAQWQTVETEAAGSKYPLVEDIRREDDGQAE